MNWGLNEESVARVLFIMSLVEFLKHLGDLSHTIRIKVGGCRKRRKESCFVSICMHINRYTVIILLSTFVNATIFFSMFGILNLLSIGQYL